MPKTNTTNTKRSSNKTLFGLNASASSFNAGHILNIKRQFTTAGVHPFDEVAWKHVKVTVYNSNGHKEDRELEFPEFWSDSAAQIAGSKYFRGRIGSDERETSAKQMITRVARTMREWGEQGNYFAGKDEAQIFEEELVYILLHQRAAFNSPVWFNVGIHPKPQCSACFILNVEDDMGSILDWITTEGNIFKRGSGAGINLSTIRSSHETLSTGGFSSGPVSFMRGADSVAGMIASGGATRRAAKMVVLNIDHPDSPKFIRAKADEEKKVRALIEQGYNMYDLNNEAWNSIQYQNANNSVRVTDEFMHAVEADESFSTRFIQSGKVAETYSARQLMEDIAKAAWECGDPGMQYDTTINKWHTCPNFGRINASNPCSEYMHVDNSSCNLASINLLSYLNDDNSFDVRDFVHTVDIMILAQDIVVDYSSYPTEAIEKNTHALRQLGLGYANIGSLFMHLGIPYDSEEARNTAAAITALMCGEAYRYSSHIASRLGPYSAYEKNRESTVAVIGMHRDALSRIRESKVFDEKLSSFAKKAWDGALQSVRKAGVRNSQVTVLAPTGTIAFMMDCATTGIEPEFALVKNKNLVGGNTMRIVNSAVPRALANLGYAPDECNAILAHIEEHMTIEGAPGLKDEHLPIFDCAVRPSHGRRSIHWQGHVRMVAATQPFLSGAVSKTFNMPSETTVEEIMEAYIMGWKLGLKAFAVYRDGSKSAQPLTTNATHKKTEKEVVGPVRRYLTATRHSVTHKFSIVGHEGYLTFSTYEDGTLGEVFIKMSKQGSTLSGLLDAFAISVSIALQHGVPLYTLASKFCYMRFEPSGYTENSDIQIATSITDYLFRYLSMRFLNPEELADLGVQAPTLSNMQATGDETALAVRVNEGESDEKVVVGHLKSTSTQLSQGVFTVADASLEISGSGEAGATTVSLEKTKTWASVDAGTFCRACGGMMLQTGTCKTCSQCGSSNGGC
ncbi:MAG: ribonucleoside-diphosphate reductase, adenosylcobalamin-dependent [Candidatus Vogelbacteria bacterium CG10_big_fil_rev_8_21_14_0_10_51_16]|uniref:Vitamin B12-dependent ribonucleotide reductase n=1 Tax=Candidatus Vogelbacteria bacterium CG10_big_fil_rev_8_21_14_0_10_51_16 TaxID=1975045 RepID=A0A2H0REP2_9BACT|nr:MAG: ribonucleoside-diphosphate reductase, adenosylcobalamin-dependent [Candidatus Vogelbacteria bacterium CG10_big_fil_rev_8_21_14_0_10_51_16]